MNDSEIKLTEMGYGELLDEAERLRKALAEATFAAFWLVWREHGDTPTYKHESIGSAAREAERLAARNPGQKFFVLPASAFAECVIQPVTWKKAEPFVASPNRNHVRTTSDIAPF